MNHNSKTTNEAANWRDLLAPYQEPHLVNSLWQVTNTLVPYFATWVLMYFSLRVSYWLTAPLVVLAGLLLIRTFIIFHDCGHGSFFKLKRHNDLLGGFLSLLVFAPYGHWTKEHALHHATSGNLDKRGRGDVWTMTVEEYRSASAWKRFFYRVIRHPVVLFVIGPAFFMIVLQRFYSAGAHRKEKLSVWKTNLGLTVWILVFSFMMGFKAFIILQISVVAVSSSIGIWFFYVQHQFEDMYWERAENWDYTKGAVLGSSYYKLPKILQWFSGNIGFHHVHHLNSRIPNYRLEKCHKNIPMFQEVKPMTLATSFKSISLRLWDEKNKKLIRFSELQNF